MKIKHILVQHLYEAQDIEKKLKSGSVFEEMAKKYSSCPSKTEGGDLGDVSLKLNRLDDDFREACLLLKEGQISNPVRTKFGYHLIKRYI